MAKPKRTKPGHKDFRLKVDGKWEDAAVKLVRPIRPMKGQLVPMRWTVSSME